MGKSERKEKITGKMVVGELHVIRQKTKINCKTDIAKAYRIPLSTLSYLKNINSTEQQSLHGCDILKYMTINRAKHGDMENELFDWFFHAQITIRQWMAKQ